MGKLNDRVLGVKEDITIDNVGSLVDDDGEEVATGPGASPCNTAAGSCDSPVCVFAGVGVSGVRWVTSCCW